MYIDGNISEIRDNTPGPEQLAMLAEECAELSQAALKLRRTIDHNASPTSTSKEYALDNLREEIADVLVCLLVIGDYIEYIEPSRPIEDIIEYKTARWRQRLKEAGK